MDKIVIPEACVELKVAFQEELDKGKRYRETQTLKITSLQQEIEDTKLKAQVQQEVCNTDKQELTYKKDDAELTTRYAKSELARCRKEATQKTTQNVVQFMFILASVLISTTVIFSSLDIISRVGSTLYVSKEELDIQDNIKKSCTNLVILACISLAMAPLVIFTNNSFFYYAFFSIQTGLFIAMAFYTFNLQSIFSKNNKYNVDLGILKLMTIAFSTISAFLILAMLSKLIYNLISNNETVQSVGTYIGYYLTSGVKNTASSTLNQTIVLIQILLYAGILALASYVALQMILSSSRK